MVKFGANVNPTFEKYAVILGSNLEVRGWILLTSLAMHNEYDADMNTLGSTGVVTVPGISTRVAIEGIQIEDPTSGPNDWKVGEIAALRNSLIIRVRHPETIKHDVVLGVLRAMGGTIAYSKSDGQLHQGERLAVEFRDNGNVIVSLEKEE